MNWWTRFSLNIRRRETPFYDRLYRIAHAVRSVSVPVIPGLHSFLYNEREWRLNAWHNFWRVVYYEPMFKSQCRSVGKNFKLWYAGNGLCGIRGNLQVYIGDNVATWDNIFLGAPHVYDAPELHIGSNSIVGPMCRIMVGKEIRIGHYSYIGTRTFIGDNSGHPVDAGLRLAPGAGSPVKESIRPVTIGDHCFLGQGCYVYPGAHISDGVFARAGTHIIGRIPPFCIVAGNPGNVRRLLKIPQAIRELEGEERYSEWVAAQDAFAAENPSVKREE